EARFVFGDALAAEAAAALGTAADGFAGVVVPAALLDEGRAHSVSDCRPAARTVRKPPINPRIPLAMASASRSTEGNPMKAYASRFMAMLGRPAPGGRIPIS